MVERESVAFVNEKKLGQSQGESHIVFDNLVQSHSLVIVFFARRPNRPTGEK